MTGKDGKQEYTECFVPRKDFSICAREYPGEGPTFVLMHGFPDNLRIYDSLAPLLAKSGRRVVAFDFLGYGRSDKPVDYPYSLVSLEGDLDAVVHALHLETIVPVAHDASGPTAINWALGHEGRVSALVLMNTYYDAAPSLRFPEFVTLFAEPALKELADAFMNEPVQFRWLLSLQRSLFARGAPAELQERAKALIPIIVDQFGGQPNSFPAFRGLTRDLFPNVQANTRRAKELAAFSRPVRIIWGAGDQYLGREVAEHLHALLPESRLSLLPLGHWLMMDGPQQVADAMLASPTDSDTGG